MKKLISTISVITILFLGYLILKNPKICAENAVSGLILCGRVIIPSLFPFTFCVLFILKSGVLEFLKIPKTLCIFLLSLIGGYPLGAKMLNNADIDRKTAEIMLYYCVNAGPAFIILAVGDGIFHSQKIGIILFIAHIFPSIFLALFSIKKIAPQKINKSQRTMNIIDNFVSSASDSAATLINISGFVILFSVFSAYITTFSQNMPFLKYLGMILEVTNGINQTNNIYTISLLLGFGGICIWCQVFSLSKNIKISYLKFALCRIFQAVTSCALTFILIKVFKISLPSLSNNSALSFSAFQSTAAVGISLVIMGIIFIISITGKNFAGNILEDIV